MSTDRQEHPRWASKSGAFHIALFVLIVVMWIATYFLWVTPNNKLHDMGLGNAVAFDVTLGTLLALGIAVVSIVFRKTCPSLILFLPTQMLAWGHSVGIWLVLVLAMYSEIKLGL